MSRPTFTGIPDIDISILNLLDDYDLYNTCSGNKYLLMKDYSNNASLINMV